MQDHLGANLKLLCSHYRSIAEVCRKLTINRAQFNKYLNGQSRPTAHNLKRICDFFGVEGYELSLPSDQFTQLIGMRSHDQERIAASDPLLELFQPMRDNANSLSRYCGYYFEYANCMSVPGQILLSLVHLREDRRHIQDADLPAIAAVMQTHMNLELAVTEEMLCIACEFRPSDCSLVPERREELTTEGGLDVERRQPVHAVQGPVGAQGGHVLGEGFAVEVVGQPLHDDARGLEALDQGRAVGGQRVVEHLGIAR